MKFTQRLIAISVITLIAAACPAAAFTPDRALQNPLFLSEIGDCQIVYGGYASDSGQFHLIYAEHDRFAQGYGALALQAGGEDTPSRIAFIAVKEYENFTVGAGVHRADGEVTIDLGAGYSAGPVAVTLAVHEVPIVPRPEGSGQQASLSLGATLTISDSLMVGAETSPGEAWQSEVYTTFTPLPKVKAHLGVGFSGASWRQAAIRLWYKQEQFVLQLGYTLHREHHSSFRFGVGFRF
ncbi:MAG TPA: hypothetical protein GX521_08935 [Firmicutes bacterium]|nr:hypothetical protein [Bacillota bacterium]